MEPHLSDLTKLLQSNEAPSDRTVSDIKEILREPSTALLVNELELQRLDQAIQALRQEQEKIRDFVKPYNTVLAPIRRIPADILLEIFYYCIATHRYPIIDTPEAPLLLTHICSSWRTIALSSSRLWSKLFIPLPTPGYAFFNPDYPLSDTAKQMIQDYERAATLRCDAIKVWLDRSGDCPLSLSVMCKPYNTANDQNLWIPRMLDNITLFAQRWQTVELVVPYDVYSKIDASLSTNALRMLRTFKLNIQEPPNIYGTPVRSPGQPFPWNSLRSSKVNTLSLSWTRFTRKFHEMPPVWKHLGRLFLHSKLPNIHLIPLFLQCPNLLECRVSIEGAHDDRSHEKRQMVSLPYLRSFIIHDTSVSHVTSEAFKAIHAPALSCVGYTRSYAGSPDRDSDILTTQLSSFCDFLEAAAIDKLMLALAYQPSSMVVDLLENTPQPKHVILGQKPLPFRQAESTGSPRYRGSPYHQVLPDLNQFDLTTLTVRECAIDSSSSLDKGVILPNLEILEVYGISKSSDDEALEMIKSRLHASKTSQIAVLQTVKLHFDRQMERDIKEEIDRYAREVGIPLKLELAYEMAEHQPKHLNPLSSAYGLSEVDGLSWGDTVEYDEFQ